VYVAVYADLDMHDQIYDCFWISTHTPLLVSLNKIPGLLLILFSRLKHKIHCQTLSFDRFHKMQSDERRDPNRYLP